MSIADKLTYLNDTKSLLREAINAAGGNLTQETPFREYAGGWLRDQSASLLLDFSKQQYVAKDKVSMFPDRVGFEDIVTFARSTGGGRFNAQGQYEWVGPDVPRIDYDPITGECRGLLVEEQRTNLLKHSSDFANAAWAKSSITVTPNAEVAPDGSASASLLVCQPGTGFKFVRRYYGNDSATKTITFFVKKSSSHAHVMLRGVASPAAARFNLDTGTVEYLSPDAISASIVAIGGGWWRISVSETQIRDSYAGIFPCSASATTENFTADGAEQVYVWGAQLEQGSFPTSYIPTEGAQVTRAGDIASVNELSPWFNSSQGSFSIKAKGHIGEPLITAGDASITADSDEMKEYQASYHEDPQATQVVIGKGLIESIRYWPRETA